MSFWGYQSTTLKTIFFGLLIFNQSVYSVNKLIFLCGYCGAGKTTLQQELLTNQDNIEIKKMIGYTSREPRLGEVEGVDYFFISSDRFEEKIRNSELLIAKKYGHGVWYGVDYSWQGLNDSVCFINTSIGAELALELKNRFPQQVFVIFIKTPDLGICLERIQRRGLIDSEVALRHKYNENMHSFLAANQDEFDLVIDNVILDESKKELIGFLQKRVF